MGILDRYARTTNREPRSKAVGARLEESLYKEFVSLYEDLGLTQSEAIRYLILEAVNEEKEENELIRSEKRVQYNMLTEVNKPNTNSIHTVKKENTNRDDSNTERVRHYLHPYVVSNQLYCPVCTAWSSKKHFNKAHAVKHGYTTSYDLLQSDLEAVKKAIQERTEQS